jgi:DNA-binding PadR family transcriptional regulator
MAEFPGDRGFGGPEPDEAEFSGPGFGRMGFHGGPGPRGMGRHGPGPRDFGPGPWARGDRRRGGRAKRGNVRAAALALLAEEPMNGYQIIQQISERSGGLWQPSPGSVYPALAQLEDENLIAQQDGAGGRRAYGLTDDGRRYAAEHAEELTAPWSVLGGAASAAYDMRGLVHQVQPRRALYRILAEDGEGDGAGADAEPGN